MIAKTLEEAPPNGDSHWTSRSMAKASGLSQSTVSWMWRAFGLKPHLVETGKLSTDPQVVDKVRDVVGLYLDPPEKAIVLCVDEKSQIQAIDRTAPTLPVTPTTPARMPHDYVRHGTTSLFAALDPTSGAAIANHYRRHRHQGFLRFLKTIDAAVPVGYDLHLILGNYATHKTPTIKKWLLRHPRFHLHFTPTSASWMNLAQSEESLTRMLSETRKYQLFCVMAHQNWSQASDRFKGALQNVGLEVILKTGRADAEYSARLLGAVDPLSVKHTVADEAAVERTHPTFFPLAEQWETYTQAIQQLRCGQAFIRLPNDTVRRVATPTLPAVTVPAGKLSAIRQHYLATYFRPLPQSRSAGTQPIASAPLSGAPAPAQVPGTATTAEAEPRLTGSGQPIGRHRPDEPDGQRPYPGPVVWRRPGRRR